MNLVDLRMLQTLSARAASSSRGRATHNLHPCLEDPVQRFLNAMEPGTYVRPHRHGPERWELFLALAGGAAVLCFDETGRVGERAEICARGPLLAVEVGEGSWHAVASLAPGTVLLELKPGPYVPPSDKDFADWAPAEGTSGATEFAAWLLVAREGSLPPGRST
ncbi:MAG: WbuC family cupin fold metalloprotein [Deltaproteobacteria bacterium]|nr:WbuC family cupin fold metalloprotein [Deltaproteobacteria bacterium]